MSETIKTIYNRRAVRRYKKAAIADELIEQVLASGRMAPSAMNKQPWKFYVLTNKEKIQMLSKEITEVAVSEMKNLKLKETIKLALSFFHLSDFVNQIITGDPVFHGAPVVIFITAPKDDPWGALDVGMCAQNIMLSAKALGLETCPVGFAKFVSQTENYPVLGIPENEEVHLAVILGFGDEEPKPHERIENNTVFIS